MLDLRTWNAGATWRDAYGDQLDGCLFFAEDAFGCPFCLEGESVQRCDPETGLRTPMASSLEDWASQLLVDWRNLTAQPLAHDWQVEHGALKAGHRLAPKLPFVLGGEFTVENLYEAEQVGLMRFRGSLARQIRDVPDGAKVTLTLAD